jgi:ubiquinone/menaquinone biosynthesis C-methylase UbiE
MGGRRPPQFASSAEKWHRKYEHLDDPATLKWHLDHPAPQLVSLTESGEMTTGGRALDIGGGVGVSSTYLAGHFESVVLLDIAESAFRFLDRKQDERIVPVVAAAPSLPFRPATFEFVYDRGCMHVLPSSLWRDHLRAIADVLCVGGTALLLERHMTPEQLTGLLPPQLTVVRSAPFDEEFTDASGSIDMLEAVLRRV